MSLEDGKMAATALPRLPWSSRSRHCDVVAMMSAARGMASRRSAAAATLAQLCCRDRVRRCSAVGASSSSPRIAEVALAGVVRVPVLLRLMLVGGGEWRRLRVVAMTWLPTWLLT